MKHLTLLPLLACSAAALAQTAPQFSPQRLSDHVRIVASDAFEGRAPDTAGEARTVDYLIQQFKAGGLQPGGDLVDGKRSWIQEVPLARFELKGPVALTLHDGDKAVPLAQNTQMAVRAAMTGATRVDFEKAPLVFVGYGVNAPERQWDDFKGLDLKGKLAVVLINDPDFETGVGDFGGKAMTYYGRWTYKYDEMARRGALGTIIVHETAPASYDWVAMSNSNTAVMYDIVRKEPGKAHGALEAWMQRDVAVDLFRRAGVDFEAVKLQARSRDFKPVALPGVSLSAHYTMEVQQIKSKNVAARVKGSVHPDETVLYSAHWDHMGVGVPDAKGDTIYNGAMDNATSIAALLELGRAFARQPAPQRSVLFLAVTAEERGLLGSEYYADHPLFPLEKTVGVINMDLLSPYGPARNFTIWGNPSLQLLDALVAEGKRHHRVYSPDPKPEAGYFFRSDHFSLAKRGVPAISYAAGNDWVDGGVAAGNAAQQAYNSTRYHRPADEWSAAWPFTGMVQDLDLLYDLGSSLANSRAWPQWSKDSEFQAARKVSDAVRK